MHSSHKQKLRYDRSYQEAAINVTSNCDLAMQCTVSSEGGREEEEELHWRGGKRAIAEPRTIDGIAFLVAEHNRKRRKEEIDTEN